MVRKEIKFVAYLRVSTDKQGASGLGIEAQRACIRAYARERGWQELVEIVEVESGRNAARPKLQEALALCRVHRCTLIVANVSQLSRSVRFLNELIDGDVPFLCDLPTEGAVGRLILQVMAWLAQHVAEQVSARTKAGLRAAKARGTKLGRPENLRPEDRARGGAIGRAVLTAEADKRAKELAPVLASIVEGGARSLNEIARELSAQGIPSPAGGEQWSGAAVHRIRARLARLDKAERAAARERLAAG